MDMIDGIVAVALAKRPPYHPLSREAGALNAARVCYDHLAGRLSVDLTDALVARGFLVPDDDVAEVTPAGARFLAKLGIKLPTRRSRLCLDWTERRSHIAGALGAAITQRGFDLGWLERMKRSQAISVTRAGRRSFRQTFGIDA